MQSAAFQGGASCIKDSAAFSFDEPQAFSFDEPQVWFYSGLDTTTSVFKKTPEGDVRNYVTSAQNKRSQ
jgi:hypothetical protein